MQITIEFALTTTDFLDIVDTAGYVIGYWADEAEVDDSGDDPTYTVSCEEGTEIHTLTKDDIELAIARLIDGTVSVCSSIKDDIRSAITEKDYGMIDAYAADVIIQAACFGSIIYG